MLDIGIVPDNEGADIQNFFQCILTILYLIKLEIKHNVE